MAKSSKIYRSRSKGRESRDGEIGKLKDAIRRLKSDKQKLLAELNSISQAFNKNVVFLKEMTEDYSVEDLVAASNKEMKLKDIPLNTSNSSHGKSKDHKWKCFDCEVGTMHIVRYKEAGVDKYFRMCSNKPRCKKRTKPQNWHDGVEKS